jgi:hypothetical protein
VAARALVGERAEGWPGRERSRLSAALSRIVASPAGREARALVEPASKTES